MKVKTAVFCVTHGCNFGPYVRFVFCRLKMAWGTSWNVSFFDYKLIIDNFIYLYMRNNYYLWASQYPHIFPFGRRLSG